MPLRRKHLWYGGLTIAAVALIAWLVRPAPVGVETATAIVAPLQVTVGDEGETRVRHRHVITAPVPGRLARLTLEPGDSVRADMIVARLAPLPLDPRTRQQAEATLEATRDLARAAVAAAGQARTALEQARRDRERAEQLVEGGAVARAEVERLRRLEAIRQREVEAADAQRRATEHDVAAARSALLASGTDATVALALRCPIGGVVLAIPERSERTVAAGDVLLEVGDPADLEIAVDLLSAEAVRVQPGLPIAVSGWGGEQPLPGRVRRVEPGAFTKVSALGVEEQRVTVMGDFTEPPRGLGDRYRLDVRIVLWQGDSVLQVPASALFRRGDAWAVFVITDDRARERGVQVGHESSDASEITAGLAPGDVVIRHPTDAIRDGVRVRAID